MAVKAYVCTREPRRRLAQAGIVWRWLREYPSGSDAAARWWESLDEMKRDSGEGRAERLQMRKNVLGGAEAGGFVDLSQCCIDSPTSASAEQTEAPIELRGAGAILTDELGSWAYAPGDGDQGCSFRPG